MKYQTMIDILMLLLSGKKMTAETIAERYGISARTVYRYIEELNICGIPVDVARGRYGGISIADTYKLPAGFFTRGEYSACINALNAMSSQINDPDIITAAEKLRRQQKSERRDLSVSGNIIVDGGTWGNAKQFTEKMRVCEEAVNEQKSITIDYISRNGEHSKRTVDPHLLIFKQNVWYIYAFCHTKQEYRTFKVGRIKSAKFTGATFKKAEFSREELELGFGYYGDRLIDVVLEIDKNSVADAEEWLGIDNIEPRGDSFIAQMTLPDDGGLVNKILGYGGAVRVLEPASLKEKVTAAARQIAEIN